MKGLLIVLLTTLTFAAPSLERVRGYFEEAKASREATENLYKSLQDYKGNDAVLLAYKGASSTLKARYMDARADKKALVSEGIQGVEKAVKLAPKQVEIRLVRLAVQENAPKVLKYKANIGEDKQLILANFDTQSTALKAIIKRYAQQSAVFTTAEMKKLGL
ncbi:hypothetical protein PQ465_19580 [Sphingobacterium oryzagri]|uniref:DUF4252 domain-containing protein n=1 Tax=Sphingobacterium oryzagri TaxID=3025669 RepID=A0ABY7WH20_9SPHI|nr:hypothetical protein [Sphingobacterium sp. KACC 22765]WDF68483.1 hypothetical protein PQ465_19580 [Sphingobacterium sp. KACC 22765]